jgi:protein-L-isoaspartate O-methyltransferase
MSPILGSGATSEDSESLIAQLHTQGKLTAPRRKTQKIRHEIEILKSKRTRYASAQTSDLSNDTKKHTTKSCETIPLTTTKNDKFYYLTYRHEL